MKTALINNKISRKGFTLVELLVVVAIIAILATIGLTVFTSAQANARDARRKSDIEAIANAIETQRVPGKAEYAYLTVAGFSGGTVPVDNGAAANTPQYCIRTSTASTSPADVVIANWGAAVQCPATPAAGSGESTWTAIPAAGFTAVGTGTAPFLTGTASWKVCTRLENSTVYCKASAQ